MKKRNARSLALGLGIVGLGALALGKKKKPVEHVGEVVPREGERSLPMRLQSVRRPVGTRRA